MTQYRGSSRGSMVGRRGGYTSNNANRPPLQNVVAMIEQIVLVDKKGKSTPWTKELQEKTDKDTEGKVHFDYAEVLLTHDIPELGLKADWGGEDGNRPMTKMRLVMPIPYDPTTQKPMQTERRDLQGLTVKKAGGPPMNQGSMVNFEKVWLKDGVLYAHYSRGGPTADDQLKHLKHTFSNLMVCVLPEGVKRDATGKELTDPDGIIIPAGKQEALIADPFDGIIVAGEEELRTAIDGLMANNRIGTPGFQLHCREIPAEGVDEAEFAANPNTRNSGFIIAKPKPQGEGDARVWVAPTTDELVEKLWKGFRGLADKFGKPGFDFEFVPMMAVHQSATLTPSNKKNDKGRDNSKIYQIYDDNGQGGVDVTDYGWTLSHVTVERMAEDSEYYYATYQNPVTTRPKIYALPDVPTAQMGERTPYHHAAVEAEAVRLGENKATYFRALKAEREAAPANPDGPRNP
jgi:hypothetical protein